MSRFRTVQTDFEELFAANTWTDNNIATYPANYSGGYANEFIIVETVPGKVTPKRSRSFSHINTVSGQYIAQVYVPTGNGLTRAMEIADLLDSMLNSKRLTSGTQTGIPVVDIVGTDSDDKSLFRVDFIVNFTKF